MTFFDSTLRVIASLVLNGFLIESVPLRARLLQVEERTQFHQSVRSRMRFLIGTNGFTLTSGGV